MAWNFVGRKTRTAITLAALALGSCHDKAAGPTYATEFIVVDLDISSPAPLQVMVQACAGLENRRLGGSVYVKTGSNDAAWLSDLDLTPSATVTADAFVATCRSHFPRCVRYSYADQQILMPNILTVGAALDAVPVDTGLYGECSGSVFDARTEFATRDAPDTATQYVFDRFGRRTTGLAMLNPGYENAPADPANPLITRDTPGTLVDFVFSQRLFTVFLVNGCQGWSPERLVLSNVVNSGHFPTPLGVYGYNSSWLIGGYLYEAQTDCLPSRNMGAIPTETGNLSFFSTRRPPITDPAELTPLVEEQVTYDPTKTYVAFVVGDGDNVSYVMSSRKAWLAERIAYCANSANVCAPLTWSLSPHIAELAPDVLAWYAATSRATGKDTFMLPPSGHLYSYPSRMNEGDQARFATAAERDARILGTHGVVHWELNNTWDQAMQDFLPRYAHAGGQIHGVVAVNVPFLYEPFPAWPADKFYEIITGADGTPFVVFRQREWRGVDDTGALFNPSPQTMANELAANPPGSVRVVYMTSDGGLTLANSFTALIPLLPPNVQIVSGDAAIELALAASGH